MNLPDSEAVNNSNRVLFMLIFLLLTEAGISTFYIDVQVAKTS